MSEKVDGNQPRRKRAPRVERARCPADVQRLAYAAAVDELAREWGVTWNDADAERLRDELGMNYREDPLHTESMRLCIELARAVYAAPRVMKALEAIVQFSETHGQVGFAGRWGASEGDARKLLNTAIHFGDPHDPLNMPGRPFTMWREAVAVHAFEKQGWWSAKPVTARTLALLSVLAGVPDWKEVGVKPAYWPGYTGPEAIADERRAMASWLDAREQDRRDQLEQLEECRKSMGIRTR